MICDLPSVIPQWTETENSMKNFQRGREVNSDVHGGDATAGVMRALPDVNWRHIINQSFKATGTDELNFDNSVTDGLQAAGKTDAKTALGL